MPQMFGPLIELFFFCLHRVVDISRQWTDIVKFGQPRGSLHYMRLNFFFSTRFFRYQHIFEPYTASFGCQHKVVTRKIRYWFVYLEAVVFNIDSFSTKSLMPYLLQMNKDLLTFPITPPFTYETLYSVGDDYIGDTCFDPFFCQRLAVI